jgi:hypothetical protein
MGKNDKKEYEIIIDDPFYADAQLPKMFKEFIQYVNDDLNISPNIYLRVFDPMLGNVGEMDDGKVFLYCLGDPTFIESLTEWLATYAHEARHLWHVRVEMVDWFDQNDTWKFVRKALVAYEKIMNPDIWNKKAIASIVDFKYILASPAEVDCETYAYIMVSNFIDK